MKMQLAILTIRLQRHRIRLAGQVAHLGCERLELLVDVMMVEGDKRVGRQPGWPVGVGHHPRPLAS